MSDASGETLTLHDLKRHLSAVSGSTKSLPEGEELCARIVQRLLAQGLLKNPLALPQEHYADLLPEWARTYISGFARRRECPSNVRLALDSLIELDHIDLRRHLAVGTYATTDPSFRDIISDVCYRIREWHAAPCTAPLQHMLCGEPGCGKSYLVRQIAEHSLPDATYVEESASDHQTPREIIEAVLSQTAIDSNSHKLVFVDEVDTSMAGAFLYSDLYHLMEGALPRWFGSGPDLRKICWFFAASCAPDFDRLQDRLRDLSPDAKGLDFLSRIPSANRLTIPSINVGPLEPVIRGVGCLCREVPAMKRIEGLVLCYLVSHRFESTRDLALLLRRSCSTMAASTEEFTWDDLAIDRHEKRRYVADFYSILEPAAARMLTIQRP